MSRTAYMEKQFTIFGTSCAKGTPKMILVCELHGLNMNFLIKTWSLLQLGDLLCWKYCPCQKLPLFI